MTKIIPYGRYLLLFTGILIINCSNNKYPDGIYAEVNTAKGLIVLNLEFEKTPMSVANLIGLAEGTIENSALEPGIPFYNGTYFHRVAENHVIQAGYPANSESRGPGYTFPNEIYPGLSHDKEGMLGMARGALHTNSSQFYITLGDRSYLDGDYTVFGNVVEGMDVVFSIVQGDTIKSIDILRFGGDANNFKSDTESFNRMVADAKIRIEQEDEQKKKDEEAIIARKWPDAVSLDDGIKYMILREGSGALPAAGSTMTLQYTGQFLDGMEFYGSSDRGRPGNVDSPESFEFVVGESSVNEGFDNVVIEMKKGEKRLIIVPSSLAYRGGGFYARQIEGRKRFVISPNTMLIYEIEVIDIIK